VFPIVVARVAIDVEPRFDHVDTRASRWRSWRRCPADSISACVPTSSTIAPASVWFRDRVPLYRVVQVETFAVIHGATRLRNAPGNVVAVVRRTDGHWVTVPERCRGSDALILSSHLDRSNRTRMPELSLDKVLEL
jgi:hypothetical protein